MIVADNLGRVGGFDGGSPVGDGDVIVFGGDGIDGGVGGGHHVSF